MRVRGSIAALLGAVAVGAAIVAVPYGAHAALQTAGLLAGCGAAGLLLAHAAVGWRWRLVGLRRQFAVAATVVAGTTLVAVMTGAAEMFVSDHDATLVGAVVIGATVIALRSAQLLSAGVLGDIDRVRGALASVGEGRRDVRVALRGRDELAELASAVTLMIERLSAEEQRREDADRARRDLVAAVSHDLRTPIASLRLIAEAVEDGIVEGEYLHEMQIHLRALSLMIDDLFELSRLEAGDIAWTMERLELADLVDETVSAMQSQARSRSVAVDAEIPTGLGAARGDPARVQRVLFNLLQNAIQHTPADGTVTVRAESAADRIEIEVSDTGTGIAAEDRSRVFEPFVRGGDDRSRGSAGAGLGLAIARAIVERHGGDIWLAEGDRGTRIRFSLPALAS